jgi:hypothetical protein
MLAHAFPPGRRQELTDHNYAGLNGGQPACTSERKVADTGAGGGTEWLPSNARIERPPLRSPDVRFVPRRAAVLGRSLAVSSLESRCSVSEGRAPRVIASERSLSLTC